jgi:CBS domain-containing protein
MAFLRQHHPFSELDEDGFTAVAQSVQIVHVPARKTVLLENGPPADAIGVVRKGAMELLTGDVVVDQLESGEVYGLTSVMTRQPPSMTVRAVEDTLSYLVPASVARRVFAGEHAVASVWAIARQRVRAADAIARTVRGGDPRFARIGSLVRRPVVTIRPDASVADAATLMRDERVSCLVIDLGDGRAIVTDRDLRTRVIAERGSFDAPVLDVATRPVREVGADTLAGEALLAMLTDAIHHLPVLDGGRLIGVVTDTDLMGLEAESPFAIRSAIERAPSDTEVIEAAASFRTVAADMVDAGADPVNVARVVSVIADAATARFLQLATDDLGAPPCAYAWIALGSAARHERALHADQDHALAFGPGYDAAAHEGYFAALAERVTAGLEAVGFPRCHGDAMAVQPAMRATLAHWAERFRTWIHQPDADAMILSSIGFDFREVGGSLEAETTLDAAVADARTNPAFLHLLARIALREEPPTGFVRGLVVESKGAHAGRLDIKHGGIVIVTAIARARAIAAGASAKDTLSRLEAAVLGGTLSPDSGAELAEAFRFLFDLRLRHQAAQVRDGVAPDDFIDPAQLGTIERSGLREAFRTIRGEQQLLALELDVR